MYGLWKSSPPLPAPPSDSKSYPDPGRSEIVMDDRFLCGGLLRLHLLRHATQEPIYGLAIIEELGRRGHRLSPGTLYPILHALEAKGFLTSSKRRVGNTAQRVYRATPAGERALKSAKPEGKRVVR